MVTCRTLYLAGIPYVLGGPILLRTRMNLISFCRFMLRDPTDRFRYLRELELNTSGRFKNPHAGELIAGVLEHATHLETLRLLHCDYLQLSERIPRAISAMSSLQDLTLISLTDEAYDLLPKLRSPLKRIECSFYHSDGNDPVDPVVLLAPFKGSLQEIKVTWVQFASQAVQYPLVTALYIDDCQFTELKHILRCFPNLQNLSLWMAHEDDDLDEEEIEDHRELNLSARAARFWNKLDSLSGSLLSLYMLGVRTKVDHLSLESSWVEKEEERMFSALLSDLRPSSIALRARDLGFDLPLLGGILAPVADRLTVLLLHIEFAHSGFAHPNERMVSLYPCFG
jgi:hypothetical protein